MIQALKRIFLEVLPALTAAKDRRFLAVAGVVFQYRQLAFGLSSYVSGFSVRQAAFLAQQITKAWHEISIEHQDRISEAYAKECLDSFTNDLDLISKGVIVEAGGWEESLGYALKTEQLRMENIARKNERPNNYLGQKRQVFMGAIMSQSLGVYGEDLLEWEHFTQLDDIVPDFTRNSHAPHANGV